MSRITTSGCQTLHEYWQRVYPGIVIAREAALATLHQTDVARGIAWAYTSACEQILADFTRSAGYKALSAGVGLYEVLADRLDRVFSCGDYVVAPDKEDAGLDVLYEGLSEYARKTMPVIAPGLVVRKNLNKSNGWAVGGFRFITFTFDLGALQKVDWTTEKPTRKKVAKQAPHSAAKGTLFDLLHESEVAHLGESETVLGLGMPTLMLGHALSRETGERELVIGHPRYNEDRGQAWWWTESLLDGHDGGAASRPATPVSPADDEPDAPVRLRKKATKENTQ